MSAARALARVGLAPIELFGRDSVTINSGGEKIFAEEVEQAIAHHPDVYDVVCAGRPSERWGQEVVAVVQLREGAAASADDSACADPAAIGHHATGQPAVANLSLGGGANNAMDTAIRNLIADGVSVARRPHVGRMLGVRVIPVELVNARHPLAGRGRVDAKPRPS